MKKILSVLLFIITFSAVNAQEGKSTKEETIAFIEEYFDDPKFTFYFGSATTIQRPAPTNMTRHYLFNVNDLEINENTCFLEFVKTVQQSLYIKNELIQELPINKSRYILHLDKVESIFIHELGNQNVSEGNRRFAYSLAISVTNEPKVISLPFKYSQNKESIETLKSSQICKAFLHLLKLCGAPETISFD